MAKCEKEVKAWTTWLLAAGQPETTIGLRTYHVRRVLREVAKNPWTLSVDDLVTYLGAQAWSPETRRSYRASLRAFYLWAQATGRRQDNPALLIPPISLPRGVPRPTPETIYQTAVLESPERTRLMIQLAAKCGLRRGEISRLARDDVVEDLLGYSLVIHGKGGHVRRLPLVDAALVEDLRAMPPGWLFPSSSKPGEHLTPAHVGVLVSRALPVGWACHTLRHRCATVAYWSTKDIRAVQELLGHAKTETTMRYTLVRPDDLRLALLAAAA